MKEALITPHYILVSPNAYIVEDLMFLLQRHFVRLDWLVHREQYHKGTRYTFYFDVSLGCPSPYPRCRLTGVAFLAESAPPISVDMRINHRKLLS